MAVYDIDGTLLNACYNGSGISLTNVYDVNGDEVSYDIPVEPQTWSMSNDYKTQIINALDEIQEYQAEHEGSYSICQFNDVHEVFSGNEPNFIDYNKGYKVLSRMLFLGDIVDLAGESRYQNAVSYMTGASASKRIIGIGNHEYGHVGTFDPDSVYKAAMNVPATFIDDSTIIFYHDDKKHNVRYIVLDYYYLSRTHADDGHILDARQLNWFASVLETAGSKDIIVAAHSMINPFYFANTEEQKSSSATIQDQQDIIDLIVAFKNRSTYSVTIDGVTHQHNFSACTGNFIMYTSGHYHALGHNDFGFHMFTCPSLSTAFGTGQYLGFTFYIINPAQKKIRVLSIRKEEQAYLTYDYTY